LFVFVVVVLVFCCCCCTESGSCYVAQASLKLTILLPQAPKCSIPHAWVLLLAWSGPGEVHLLFLCFFEPPYSFLSIG
jgi:hypothetical protein